MAGLHKTVFASKAIFLPNTSKNAMVGASLTIAFLFVLMQKVFAFEVLHSFAPWIFFCDKE